MWAGIRNYVPMKVELEVLLKQLSLMIVLAGRGPRAFWRRFLHFPSGAARIHPLFQYMYLFGIQSFWMVLETAREDELMLTKMYESKYQELEALLAEKDAALNETYSVRICPLTCHILCEESHFFFAKAPFCSQNLDVIRKLQYIL